MLDAPQLQMLQRCGACRQMCRCEGNDLTEMLIGVCDPKLRDADERCPACVGPWRQCAVIPPETHDFRGPGECLQVFRVSFATACVLTPLSTFSSWNFLRHSGTLKRHDN